MSKGKKPPFVPTRTCPHRWCKPLHLVPIPFVLAVFAFDLWHNWRMLVALAGIFFIGYWVPKIVHFKRTPRPTTSLQIAHVMEDLRSSPTAIDLEIQDAKYEGTGWRMLEVRKGWARVAVGCDLFLVTLVSSSATAVFTNPTAEAQKVSELRIDGNLLIALLIGAAIFGFNLYAHKKATQPRKPKRAWVPGFLRTSGSS